MGLVDCEQREANAFIHRIEELEEATGKQAFRCKIKELEAAIDRGMFPSFALNCSKRAIDTGSGDTIGLEALNLVLHQSNQGRDDNRQTRQMEGWQLIGERFTAAGRHQNQGIMTIHNQFYNLALPYAKRIIAK